MSSLGLLSRIASRLGYVPKAQASFEAAQAARDAATVGRIEGRRVALSESRSLMAALTLNDTASWASAADTTGHINTDTAQGLATARARSRDAARNNEFARGFIGLVDTNIVGPYGVRMQSRVQQANGALKKSTNDRLEAAWERWGERGNCDVTCRYSWLDIQRLVIKHVARDGEILVRFVPGRGPHGFALQLIDASLIDVTLRSDLPGGNRIRQGVELTAESRVVAWHVLADTTTDEVAGLYSRKHVRIPADEAVHLMLPEEVNQLRGTPWMTAALRRLWMTHDFATAGLNAARESAKRRGWFTSPDGTPAPGATEDDGAGGKYQPLQDGQYDTLPQGYSFTAFESKYPNIEFGQFVKDCLRTVSTGLGVSYISLGNDLSEVNYSSARVGILLEREVWRGLQQWLIDSLHKPVYRRWLRYALLADADLQSLDYAKLDLYAAAAGWQPRVWAGVDPLKEVEAEGRELELGLTSPQRLIAKRGDDPEQIIEERRLWAQMTAGIPGMAGTSAAATSNTAPAEPDADDAAQAAARSASRRWGLIVNDKG